ncbi:MAG: GNAT family N-acetyltransferase [Thermoanaerobaculia bacterium]
MTSQASSDPFTIVPFRDEFARAFAALNLEWLEKFELLEDGDLPYLRDPRGSIIDKGGVVLCALSNGEVVGTVAVVPLSAGTFELVKLAVAPSARGRGLGRRLTQAAIDFASSAGAEVLTLCSSHKLREAVSLYESMGFTHTASRVGAVTYVTADVFMELSLKTRPQC